MLQFGGASGSGYMTQEQMEAGTAELKAHGTFEKGVFRRNEGEEGKRNLDGYQAVWEHVNKRAMNYPAQRYHDPIMMSPEHFEWVPLEGAPGVCEKLMGVFTERRCEARFLRLAPQASIRASGRKIYFILTGDGQVGGQAYRRYTTVSCEQEEEAAFLPRRRLRCSYSACRNWIDPRITPLPRNSSCIIAAARRARPGRRKTCDGAM